MRVHLLGTGSADGWPNPFCACARCRWARDTGQVRGRTSVLVDDRLLVDPGPDIGRGGVDLSGVRGVLITHAHPDHLDPAFLLAWTWAHGCGLQVVGPPEAVAACRPWVGPDAPVTFRELVAGDTWVLAGDNPTRDLHVRALPAAHSTTGGHEPDGTALLYELTAAPAANRDRGASDAEPTVRVLHATDTARLPHADLVGPYDLVLMELTFGDVPDHGTAHLDLVTFGRELARLRRDGRLARGSRVVAIHLSHHNPEDVVDRLAAIGASAVPDGTVLDVPALDAPALDAPALHASGSRRLLLVTGGARSGKSRRAEQLASTASWASVTYVATAEQVPDDPEWSARIAAHRRRRPRSWTTVETLDVAGTVRAAGPDELVLVDCLALWVTRVIDAAAAWDDPAAAEAAIARGLDDLLGALRSTGARVVLVTNEVGAGVVPHTRSGRLFRDLLGRMNIAVAAVCDDVELVVAGIPTTLKGRPWTTTST